MKPIDYRKLTKEELLSIYNSNMNYCSTMAQTLICGHLKPFAVGSPNATAQS